MDVCKYIMILRHGGTLNSRRTASPVVRRVEEGLLVTDMEIFNHGQVTKTTPELMSPSPNYHTTPTGGVREERRLSRNVRSQQSQILAQITTQFNQGASRTVSKWNAQRSLHRVGFGSRRPTRVSLLNVRHRITRLAWAREITYTEV
ncbi:HTH_Tnp_Tc3_2 domain-containing protein [Trichonephila clavipes]|uniref:HTH_Tnp_Tc3_2 domain-containing protein n=1 Tax=Trichonephila clavipes TaxID=2585209 RepID=A0A8X6SIV0_TRICX|nr:HTH_Tnp_Tc3_2 domain-containing protein [Trichonephila clavipes]